MTAHEPLPRAVARRARNIFNAWRGINDYVHPDGQHTTAVDLTLTERTRVRIALRALAADTEAKGEIDLADEHAALALRFETPLKEVR